MVRLWPFQEAEHVRLGKLVRRSQTRLAILLPRLKSDPLLSGVVEMVRIGQAKGDPAPPVKYPLAVTREFAAAPEAQQQAELDQAMAVAAERRARLKVHELQILADPGLRQIYTLLKHPQAGNQPGTVAEGG